jgi:hypothetical protein
MTVPGSDHESRVAERDQVAGDAARAEPDLCGQRGSRNGLVECGQDDRPGAPEQPFERFSRCRGRLPEPGDASGGVDEGGQPVARR